MEAEVDTALPAGSGVGGWVLCVAELGSLGDGS